MIRLRCTTTCALLALSAISGCTDKTLLPTAARSPVVALQVRTNFAAQNAPTARSIDVRVGYEQLSGSRVAIGSRTIAATGGAQQISIQLDLAACLADENRAGARDVCPVRIAIALRDTSAIALDSLEIGPVDAVAGASPNVPQVDLAIARFSVRSFVTDEALRLAGNPQFDPAAMTGLVTGAGPPTIYWLGSGGVAGNAIAILENGRWRTVSFGNGGVFLVQDFAILSPTEGWVVASLRPTNGLFRFDGTSLTAIPTVRDSLHSVAAVTVGTSRFVVAIGPGSVLWRGDGANWTRETFPASGTLNHVCVTAADEAFVLAGATTATDPIAPTMLKWNGTQWTTFQIPFFGDKSQLFCPARGQAFLRVRNGSVVPNTFTFLSFNGTSFDPIPTTGVTGATLQDFAVVSPTEMYGWGRDNILGKRIWYRFNGVTWQQIAQSPFVQSVDQAWADPRGGRVYMRASTQTRRLEAFEIGQRTTLAYFPATRDIMMSSATSAFAVGQNVFLARWDGSRWTVDAPPANTPALRSLQGVWTDGPSNAWAVGNNSTIMRWNGSNWTVVSDTLTPIAGFDNYNAVWGSGSTTLIGGAGVLRCTSTNACANDVVPGAGAILGIWGTALSNVFAVGANGRIVRHDGTSWQQMPSTTTRNLARVWGSSASDVWAVGDSVLLHFNGTAWSNVPMTGPLASLQTQVNPTGTFQIGLWGSASNDVYLGGLAGRIARFDGRTWALMTPDVNNTRVVAITGVAATGALALSDRAVIWRGVGPNGGFAAPIVAASIWP